MAAAMQYDAVVPDMYSAQHADDLLNYGADLTLLHDDLPDLGCGLQLPSPAISTSQDMFRILESMGTGVKQEPSGASAAAAAAVMTGGNPFLPNTAAAAAAAASSHTQQPPRSFFGVLAQPRKSPHVLRSNPYVTHTLSYAGLPTPPASPGQSDAEHSSCSSDDDDDDDDDGDDSGLDASHNHGSGLMEVDQGIDTDSSGASPVPPPPRAQVAAPATPRRAGLRQRRAKLVEQAPATAKAMSVLRTAKEKVQFKKRRGWKCTPEYLLNNITSMERDKLIKKGLHIPKSSSGRATLTKAKERLIRKELRKIRNVASAQRHRLEQKEYIEELEGKIHEGHRNIEKLNKEVGSLRAEQAAWAEERATMLRQLRALRGQAC